MALTVLADVGLYAAGCLLLGWLVHRWRRTPRPAVVVTYALLALAFTSPALLTPRHQVSTDKLYRHAPWVLTHDEEVVPGNPLLVDPVLQMYPMRSLVRDRLLSGEAPLWSHEMGTGQPLLGNAQTSPFAPLHLLALPLPTLRAMTVAATWQLFLALLLTHALMIFLGARPAAAAVAAVAFAFSTFMVVWLYYPMGMTAAFLPGVLLGIGVIHRGGRGGVAGTAACALGMATAGHPETVAHAALVAAGLALVLLVRGPEPGRWRFVARLAVAGLLVAALAAPVLLPVLEALPDSQRSVALADDPPSFHSRLSWRSVPPLIDPLVYGSPRDRNWIGDWNFHGLAAGWAGLATLALALAGAVRLRGRVLAIVVGGLLALLVALAVDPFLAAVEALPLLEHGAHSRLRLLWALALALAAGLTLDRLGVLGEHPRGRAPSSERSEARRLDAGAGAAGDAAQREGGGRSGGLAATVVGVLLLAAMGLAAVPPPGGEPWQDAWYWTVLVGAGLLAITVALPRTRRLAVPVALLVIGADLFVLGVRYNPAVQPELRPSTPPVLEVLVERAEGGPWRVAAEGWALPANTGALWNLWDPRGNDPMRPAAPVAHLARRLEGRRALPAHVTVRLDRADYRFLDFLSVRYLLIPGPRRMPPPWHRVFQGRGGRVWENGAAVELFFVPPRVVPVFSEDEAWQTAVRLDDVVDVAVVEGLERRRELPGLLGGAQEGEVELTEVTANGFRLRAACPSGCVVASSVSHATAWRVWVDGEPDEPLRLHRAFLALGVPPGEHELVVEYRPAGWPLGLALAGIAALGLLGHAGWRWRRRRRAP